MTAPDIDVEAVRAEVRQWIAAQPAPITREALVDSGWAAPTWPREWFGRGLPKSVRKAVDEELKAAGIKGGSQDVHNLWANVVLDHGTEEQKHAFVRRLAAAGEASCLLYSEPGAGSDLAAVQTRADADGDGWIVNGQKVWTSGARTADFGLLLARTDWDVPKHKGVSLFLMPMEQPGVEVRPIPQVTGGAHFNEVFLTDVRVERVHLLGEVNDGWRVLQTALGYERQIMGESGGGPSATKRPDPHSPWTRVIGGLDYVELARRTGAGADADLRQETVRVYSLETVNRWNGLRARAEAKQGLGSPAASIGKLAMSEIVHAAVRLTSMMLGPESLLDGDVSADAAEINRSTFAAFVTSIGGGTDQIQRNILGERVLGLPKEPEVDRDVPFRDVRKAEAKRR